MTETSMTPVQLCKCLADDNRLRLVALLWQRGELCVCELVALMDQPQPTVSRQLGQLRACQLVTVRRDARWAYYRIASDLPDWAQDVLAALLPASTPVPGRGGRNVSVCRP
ncbi:MAG: metalloregulator ArsR/SmtB family transcription factor [Alcanivoracaceae bacterium]|nr:metalloregulator ArsR/SmtB family transcription factor [Alcanivoracaceae bacterium]